MSGPGYDLAVMSGPRFFHTSARANKKKTKKTPNLPLKKTKVMQKKPGHNTNTPSLPPTDLTLTPPPPLDIPPPRYKKKQKGAEQELDRALCGVAQMKKKWALVNRHKTTLNTTAKHKKRQKHTHTHTHTHTHSNTERSKGVAWKKRGVRRGRGREREGERGCCGGEASKRIRERHLGERSVFPHLT